MKKEPDKKKKLEKDLKDLEKDRKKNEKVLTAWQKRFTDLNHLKPQFMTPILECEHKRLDRNVIHIKKRIKNKKEKEKKIKDTINSP